MAAAIDKSLAFLFSGVYLCLQEMCMCL